MDDGNKNNGEQDFNHSFQKRLKNFQSNPNGFLEMDGYRSEAVAKKYNWHETGIFKDVVLKKENILIKQNKKVKLEAPVMLLEVI